MTSGRLTRTALIVGVIGLLLIVAEALHVKRTRMRQTGENTHRNQLANETSPYLLQHADNPVNWMPWSPEAFELARRQDKPVFISIGYSTCHWCHVMEHQCFENHVIASILNQHFICIKIDREERPDIDAVYMRAVQMMTGSGGWPLSVFTDADGKPFFGGTYFPPHGGQGGIGFLDLLETITKLWTQDRRKLLASSDQIVDALHNATHRKGDTQLSDQLLNAGYEYFQQAFDPNYGGFGQAPKFPQPTALDFLLTQYHRTAAPEALAMVRKTLDEMADGGVYDQLGGGFHRYATDARWLTPHFEKMLYDQALLARVYVEVWQLTGQARYASIARDVFDYVLRDMTDKTGAFYCAEDADSEGSEGLFYLWRKDQIDSILGEKAARLFCDYYGVTEKGNFQQPLNILHVAGDIESLAGKAGITVDAARASLAESRSKLLAQRSKRVRPARDDKIITGWNALMISALAYGGSAMDEPRYVDAASRAGRFIRDKLVIDGELARYYRSGKVVEHAFLDDYAFLTAAMVDLYEATFDPAWLVRAKSLADEMIARFSDGQGGAMFMTAAGGEKLIVRAKPDYDGAVPAGNSVAASALLRLSSITADDKYRSAAENILKAFANQMAQAPASLTEMLTSTARYLGRSREIVIAAGADKAETRAMLKVVRSRYLPDSLVLLHPQGDGAAGIEAVADFVTQQKPLQGHATAYLCEDYACKEPVTDPNALKALLDGRRPPR